MPTITIDLPDHVSLPVNWDAKSFFATILYKESILSSSHVDIAVSISPTVLAEPAKDYTPVEPESDSWFTPEQHAQFRENRRRLEEKWANDPDTEKDQEELYQLLLKGPVADEETIQMQNEIREHMKQWKLPW